MALLEAICGAQPSSPNFPTDTKLLFPCLTRYTNLPTTGSTARLRGLWTPTIHSIRHLQGRVCFGIFKAEYVVLRFPLTGYGLP